VYVCHHIFSNYVDRPDRYGATGIRRNQTLVIEREEKMTDAIVKHEQPVSIIRSMDDAERAARSMVASGFFADSKQAAQAVVKILAGQELGFGPFASMTGVNIIQNKPVLAANLMAAAVKRQGKYNYRVVDLTDERCELAFFEAGQEVGRSIFGKADAEKAGLLAKDNWRKYPRNMYFARALSNGQKWYAPDVFNGATVYTPDELGAKVDEEGNAVIDVAPITAADPALMYAMPYEQAAAMMAKGKGENAEEKRFDTLTASQLQYIVEHSKETEKVEAALTVLEHDHNMPRPGSA
jgi:hypothetical protein